MGHKGGVYRPLLHMKTRVHAPSNGVFIISLNGHVHNSVQADHAALWLYMGFFVNGVDIAKGTAGKGEDWGKYHSFGSASQSRWASASFTQYHRVQAGNHEVELMGKAHTLSGYT